MSQAMLRERRQAHQAVGEQPVEARKADEEALIQAPSPTRSLARKRDAVPDAPHDLHVLLRHRLLRKPGGFEGLRAIRKVPLPKHQAPPQPEELKEGLVHGHATARSMPYVLTRAEKLIAQVEDLDRFSVKVLEGVDQLSPDLLVAVMAVKNRDPSEDPLPVSRGVILDAGVEGQKHDLEVATIYGRRR